MEFQLEGESDLIKAEVIRNKGSGEMVFRINDKDYELKLLKSSTSGFEFILGNTFHEFYFQHLLKFLTSSVKNYSLVGLDLNFQRTSIESCTCQLLFFSKFYPDI